MALPLYLQFLFSDLLKLAPQDLGDLCELVNKLYDWYHHNDGQTRLTSPPMREELTNLLNLIQQSDVLIVPSIRALDEESRTIEDW